jgi:hypothetical protein
VIVPLVKEGGTPGGESQFRTLFAEPLSGTNPFSGNIDQVSQINRLLLRNNGLNEAEFTSNSVGTMITR